MLYHGGRLFANFAYLQTMKLRKVAPDSVWMHQAAGEANESQGYYDAAVREYREVLALDPRRPGIHFRIGRSLLSRAQAAVGRTAREPRARRPSRSSSEELRLDPTNANAAYELGEIHRQAGELEKAAELFARAVEHYPDFDEAQIGLGRVLVAPGQAGAGACRTCRRPSPSNPRNEVAYYQLAPCQRALGNEAGQRRRWRSSSACTSASDEADAI